MKNGVFFLVFLLTNLEISFAKYKFVFIDNIPQCLTATITAKATAGRPGTVRLGLYRTEKERASGIECLNRHLNGVLELAGPDHIGADKTSRKFLSIKDVPADQDDTKHIKVSFEGTKPG